MVKSISKSYGVPGLRLGVLASGDEEMIAALKKEVSIWNINSFAEFYMQISEKYKRDYIKSLARIREERSRLIERLNQYGCLRAFPSQANYILCEIIGGKTSRQIVTCLLKNNILAKDITAKAGNGKQYLRIAVRSETDNERLLKALQDIH